MGFWGGGGGGGGVETEGPYLVYEVKTIEYTHIAYAQQAFYSPSHLPDMSVSQKGGSKYHECLNGDNRYFEVYKGTVICVLK